MIFATAESEIALKLLISFCTSAILFVFARESAKAVPPLVVGDVPTADKNHIEWYIGTRYQKENGNERQIPFTELVYGISNRQEITFEIPYLSAQGVQGFGDAVLGTKYQILLETKKNPGVATSFELKLTNGNQSEGLGTGALEYDLRFRSEKTLGLFTSIANVGYTIVGEPEENGLRQERQNVLFAAFAQEFKISSTTEFLSETYWRNSDEPGEPNRFALDIGCRERLSPHLALHEAVGKSLRSGNIGGPTLRIYAGIKLEFSMPKRQNHKPILRG